MANDHDTRYKVLFSNPLMVKRLVESFVHEPFLSGKEIVAVEPVDKESVGIDSNQRRSDVIWKIRAGSIEFFLYLLIEFQSTVEQSMAFRALEYVTHIYRRLFELSGKTGVPSVFPIVLYSGDEAWSAATNTQDLHTGPMSPTFFPHFSYYPIVIRDIPDESLVRIRNAVSAVFLVENTNPKRLAETIDLLVDILKEEMPELRRVFAHWFEQYMDAYGVPFSTDDIEKRIAENESMLGTKLERYKDELRQEGVEQARAAIRLLRQGVSTEQVAKDTGLSLSEVQELADEINS